MENKNTELIKNHHVEGTPFNILEVHDEGAFIILGQYRVSETMNSVKECQDYIDKKPWNLILSTVLGMVQNELKTQMSQYENKQHSAGSSRSTTDEKTTKSELSAEHQEPTHNSESANETKSDNTGRNENANRNT